MNAAIFAPGWVLECNDERQYLQNEKKFWSLLEKYVVKKPINELPLVTTFNQGSGEKFFINGELMDSFGKWYNLNLQSLQPSGNSFSWCFDDAFYGGNCIQLKENSNLNLFDLKVTSEHRIKIKYAFKANGELLFSAFLFTK